MVCRWVVAGQGVMNRNDKAGCGCGRVVAVQGMNANPLPQSVRGGGSSLRTAPCEDLRRVPTGRRTGNDQRFI